MDLSRCSLNSITVKGLDLDGVVALATEHGFGGVAPWRDLLDDVDLPAAAARIRDAGLRVSSVCRGGMFVTRDALERRKRFDDNLCAVEQAHTLAADCLVLVCGAGFGDLAEARAQVRDGIAALEPHARAAGVRLAIEPFHPMMAASRSVITSLREANDLVADLRSDHVGIALDSYHVWWDVTMLPEIARAGRSLFSVQLADWITPICGELSSRGMPGEGCIDMTGFVTAAETAGYRGLIEVEVLSDRWWSESADVVCRAAVTGLAGV